MTPQWTTAQKVAHFMRLPWTVSVDRDLADGSLIASVTEIPDAIATGANESALMADLWQSLKASIECRLEFGDSVTIPAGAVLPWELGQAPPVKTPLQRIKIDKELFSVSPGTLASV